MAGDADEIDLASLSDDDLVAQMHDDLYDGLADEIAEGTNLLLGRGWSADDTLNRALVEGMRIVGIDFRDGILFVPEVLLADQRQARDQERRGLRLPQAVQLDRGRSERRHDLQEPGRLDDRGRRAEVGRRQRGEVEGVADLTTG